MTRSVILNISRHCTIAWKAFRPPTEPAELQPRHTPPTRRQLGGDVLAQFPIDLGRPVFLFDVTPELDLDLLHRSLSAACPYMHAGPSIALVKANLFYFAHFYVLVKVDCSSAVAMGEQNRSSRLGQHLFPIRNSGERSLALSLSEV
jgi:hypothetical protein